jgi:cytochrome c553
MLAMAWLASSGVIATAQGAPASGAGSVQRGRQLFALRVYPLLELKCGPCHGSDPAERKGGLDLLSRAGAMSSGESGERAVVPGQPLRSALYRAIRWDDLEMPPKRSERLTSEQVEWFRQWISAGAPWLTKAERLQVARAEGSPSDGLSGILVRTSGGLSEQWDLRRYDEADLWAFRSLGVPELPEGLAGDAAAEEVIDAVVAERLAAANLPAALPADRRTLIRRVTYDLTGLPPSPEQIDAFVNDPDEAAYDKLVDRLLASPQYGEQWARHWLDVVRYADTSGRSRDDPRPHAWRYRDYVVRSFNADKPFDQFVREQLAGDEIDRRDPEMLIATGFLRAAPWEHTAMSSETETRQQFLDDVTNAVGETFLGISLRCARCHDHKFDPISTRDYYRIQAVFAPAQLAEPQAAFLPAERPQLAEGQQALFEQQIAEARAHTHRLRRQRQTAQVRWLEDRGHTVSLASLAETVASLPVERRPPRHLGLSPADLGLQKVWAKRIEYFERRLQETQPRAMAVYSGPHRVYRSHVATHDVPLRIAGQVAPTRILLGGSLANPGQHVTPGVLSAMGYDQPEHTIGDFPITSAMFGRRLALARWLVDPRNTLTARVIVNRLWQTHFGGLGLVRSPDNFGAAGEAPTHPALLDYLARWLINEGWSLKRLHRAILLSQTYRRASTVVDPDLQQVVDPENRLLAFFPPRPLTAEEIRDSQLLASGELNLRPGGPAVATEISWEAAVQPIQIMGTFAPAWQPALRRRDRHRRSLYTYRQRNRGNPWMEALNQPDSITSCPRREQSTGPTQALALLNSRPSYQRALAIAESVRRTSDAAPDWIDAVYRRVLGRSPSPQQMQQTLGHLDEAIRVHEQFDPPVIDPPTHVERHLVEEMTGQAFRWTESLDAYFSERFEPDLEPWQAEPACRALAEVCLVLLNTDEFLYVY